ncbi:hypothetical protein, partial [Rhodococcus sp. YH1]|uniref:hypothetical protein n=1 Tax=Rhodococcus sp. YH1 TaxID=89066 RepID=UPI001386AAD9
MATAHPVDTRLPFGRQLAFGIQHVLIMYTGFHILDMPIAGRMFDGQGRSLDEHWQGSPQAFLGSSVAGFP